MSLHSRLTESESARFLGLTVDQLSALSATGYVDDKFLPSPLHWALGFADERCYQIDELRRSWLELNA